MDYLVDQYLSFLEVPKKEPSLSYLNELIYTHQYKVRWENLTKIIDTQRDELKSLHIPFLPKIEDYITRMVRQGTGGTCWTLAIGFKWLLTQLGFNTSYLYMDSGHLCLRVDLNKNAYYVDVGYCAPLFQAYPLFESFHVSDNRETFQYKVVEQEIIITREPGPTKVLDPDPITIEQMIPLIIKSNDWKVSAPLKNILIFGYIDGHPTSLTNNILKQYRSGKKIEQQLSAKEVREFVQNVFHIDLEIYEKASQIFQKHNQLA